MSRDKKIVDGRFAQLGVMCCRRCKRPLKGEYYLHVHIYNIHDRGNETDTTENYCRKCSANDRSWNIFRKAEEQEERDRLISLSNARVRAIELIRTASRIDIDDNGDGEFEIWVRS